VYGCHIVFTTGYSPNILILKQVYRGRNVCQIKQTCKQYDLYSFGSFYSVLSVASLPSISSSRRNAAYYPLQKTMMKDKVTPLNVEVRVSSQNSSNSEAALLVRVAMAQVVPPTS
jgi:hypothetical protein